jgi:hypothetical protein
MPPSVDEVRLQLVKELVASYVTYVKALQNVSLATEQRLERDGVLDGERRTCGMGAPPPSDR